jgi:DNA-binding transcriptional ArsR family regulator
VKILYHQKKSPNALCVNALSGLLGVSQPAISQHLRILKAINLVKGDRRGNHIHYCINPDMEKRYQELLKLTLGEKEAISKEYCQIHCL